MVIVCANVAQMCCERIDEQSPGRQNGTAKIIKPVSKAVRKIWTHAFNEISLTLWLQIAYLVLGCCVFEFFLWLYALERAETSAAEQHVQECFYRSQRC
jgi:hypothetical protein